MFFSVRWFVIRPKTSQKMPRKKSIFSGRLLQLEGKLESWSADMSPLTTRKWSHTLPESNPREETNTSSEVGASANAGKCRLKGPSRFSKWKKHTMKNQMKEIHRNPAELKFLQDLLVCFYMVYVFSFTMCKQHDFLGARDACRKAGDHSKPNQPDSTTEWGRRCQYRCSNGKVHDARQLHHGNKGRAEYRSCFLKARLPQSGDCAQLFGAKLGWKTVLPFFMCLLCFPPGFWCVVEKDLRKSFLKSEFPRCFVITKRRSWGSNMNKAFLSFKLQVTKLAQSQAMGIFWALVILTNSVYLGVQLEWTSTHRNQSGSVEVTPIFTTIHVVPWLSLAEICHFFDADFSASQAFGRGANNRSPFLELFQTCIVCTV